MRRPRIWVSALFALLALGAGGCTMHTRGQPLAFNHKLHANNAVPCSVCHPTAATGIGATLPTVATCQRCHEDVLYEPPERLKIRLAAASGRGLAWVPVYALRPYVYFSHRRHVTLGKIACEACHGDVELRTAPFEGTSPFRGRRGMMACIRCHEESHSPYAGVDCVDCHR